MDFDEALAEFNLIQLVKFETWSRMERRSSILDHIYLRDPTLVTDLKYVNPFFGDHVLVEFMINVVTRCREWRNYSKDILNEKLSSVEWNIEIVDVQQYWK